MMFAAGFITGASVVLMIFEITALMSDKRR